MGSVSQNMVLLGVLHVQSAILDYFPFSNALKLSVFFNSDIRFTHDLVQFRSILVLNDGGTPNFTRCVHETYDESYALCIFNHLINSFKHT